MKMPTAGDLRDQVEIQRLRHPPEVDEFGAHKEEWETIDNPRARVRDATGREIWFAKTTLAEVDIAVDLRFHPDLAKWAGAKEGPKMRLIDVLNNRRVLNISAVLNPDGKKIWHLCLCKR